MFCQAHQTMFGWPVTLSVQSCISHFHTCNNLCICFMSSHACHTSWFACNSFCSIMHDTVNILACL